MDQALKYIKSIKDINGFNSKITAIFTSSFPHADPILNSESRWFVWIVPFFPCLVFKHCHSTWWVKNPLKLIRKNIRNADLGECDHCRAIPDPLEGESCWLQGWAGFWGIPEEPCGGEAALGPMFSLGTLEGA